MEESWENWPLHMEMGHDDDFLEKCHTNDDEFLRDILQQPAFSSESETTQSFHPPSIVQNNFTATAAVAGASAATGASSLSSDEIAGFERPGNLMKSNSSNSIVSQHASKRPRRSSSPRTYILSFDNSTVMPATPEPPYLSYEQLDGEGTRSSNSPLSSKRTLQGVAKQNVEPKPRANQGGRKTRSDCQSMDHIMAERKRRQELTERFIALSATIPGLTKTDKASVLREAINYVKQLQQRVTELEKRDVNKRGEDSTIVLQKSELCANEDSTSSETSSGDCNDAFPEVEARVWEKEVLIEIHCEKQNGIELKLLDHLENLHLCVTGSSVLPFGNSTLGITIIAQMGEAYKMSVNDLVKNLRQVLVKSHDLQQ